MQVGSLVICPKGIPTTSGPLPSLPASEDIIYTVSEIFKGFGERTHKPGMAIRLEEVPITNSNKEYGYPSNRFKEVQPPMDISILIEECILVEI